MMDGDFHYGIFALTETEESIIMMIVVISAAVLVVLAFGVLLYSYKGTFIIQQLILMFF